MKTNKLFKKIIACALIPVFALLFTAMPDQIRLSVQAQEVQSVYNPEELEQLLAPIALYPDALLAQVLAAATYPLEIVAADRFAKEHAGLQGGTLLAAAEDKDWEPSVKAMLGFPDVLAMMSQQLEWTNKLGNAFLSQQADCMNAVQRLRQKAYTNGNLTTNGQQVVQVEPQTQVIVIQPASTEIVYVPVYDPFLVYGYWPYPGYPPYYFYTGNFVGISFFSPVYVNLFWGAGGIWFCDWHDHHVYVHADRYNHFERSHYKGTVRFSPYRDSKGDQPWRFDSRHSAPVRGIVRGSRSPERTQPAVRQTRREAPRQTAPVQPQVTAAPSDVTRTRAPLQGSPTGVIRQVSPERSTQRSRPAIDSNVKAEVQRRYRTTSRDVTANQPLAQPAVQSRQQDRQRSQVRSQPSTNDVRFQRGSDNLPAAGVRGRAVQRGSDNQQDDQEFSPRVQGINGLRGGSMRPNFR